MTSDRAPRAGLVTALLVLLLVLVGCGGDGDAGTEPSPGNGAPLETTADTTPGTDAAEDAPTDEPSASDAGGSADTGGSADAGDRVVSVVDPEEGTLTATRSASATLRAVRDADVAAGASGRVVEILARPGDRVEAGATVVRIDDTQARLQLRSAELALRQAEVDLEGARRSSSEGAGQASASLRAAEANAQALRDQVEDVRALVEAGGAARSDLRSLEVQLEQAEAQAGQARDAVAQAGRSGSEDLALLELRLESARVQVAQARESVTQTQVTAPFAGEVVELHVEAGEFAAAGSPAFRIQSTGELEAVFDVPPEDAVRLQDQGTVTLRYAGRELPAEIVSSARPAQQPRSVRLTARLNDEAAAAVPAGALADLRYTVTVAQGMLLPSGAISAEAGSTYVYVVRDGVATRIPVDVLAEAGATAAVEGVDTDDRVIAPRPLDVRQGTPVRTAGG